MAAKCLWETSTPPPNTLWNTILLWTSVERSKAPETVRWDATGSLQVCKGDKDLLLFEDIQYILSFCFLNEKPSATNSEL